MEGPKKLRDSFVGPFIVKSFNGPNAVEVILTEEYQRKHPTFPISLVKKYITSNNTEKTTPPAKKVVPPMLDENEGLIPHKVLNERTIMRNNQRIKQYLVRFKNKLADQDKWLESKDIKDGDTLLRSFRFSKRQ